MRSRTARIVMAESRVTPWRHQLADSLFDENEQAEVLTTVRAGTPLADALAPYGLSREVAYGRARWDHDWRDALYAAQMDGRNPALAHGIPATYRAGCECPECRATQTHATGAHAWMARNRRTS